MAKKSTSLSCLSKNLSSMLTELPRVSWIAGTNSS
jgi:hypothetical protein